MLSPDRPVVRARGFRKPAPELKETAPKYTPSQQDAIATAVSAPEVTVSEVSVSEISVSETGAVAEVVIEAPVETAIVEPAIEIAATKTPVAEIPLAAAEPKAETPAKSEIPASAEKSAVTGGVRISKGFAKSSAVATPTTAGAAPVQASISPKAPQVAALNYQPDNDPAHVSRRQWWKHHLYVRSGRQAMEHPKS
jgi:hypothetical protein